MTFCCPGPSEYGADVVASALSVLVTWNCTRVVPDWHLAMKPQKDGKSSLCAHSETLNGVSFANEKNVIQHEQPMFGGDAGTCSKMHLFALTGGEEGVTEVTWSEG